MIYPREVGGGIGKRVLVGDSLTHEEFAGTEVPAEVGVEFCEGDDEEEGKNECESEPFGPIEEFFGYFRHVVIIPEGG